MTPDASSTTTGNVTKRPARRRKRKAKRIPYENAVSGDRAREEARKVLLGFGCEKIGFMDDTANHEVTLYFEHRGRSVRIPVSAKGWAEMWVKQNPLSYRHRKSMEEHKQDALRQGYLAVSSILRDLIKGQVTAIETGILSFEAVFMPHMLTSNGRSLLERVQEQGLLPKPDAPKVVQMIPPPHITD